MRCRYLALLAIVLVLGGAGGALYLWRGDPRGRAEALCREAEACLRQGDPDRALLAYRRAAEADPESGEALAGAGRIQLSRRLFHEAVAYLRRAAALRGADARTWMDLGRALREGGAREEAVAACRRAADLAPDRGEVLIELGRALAAQGRSDEALRVYRRAEALGPEDATDRQFVAEAHAEVGRLYAQMGDADSAAAGLLRAAMRRPGDAGILCDLGEVSLRGGRVEEAIVYFEGALRRDPRLARARYLLGRAYVRAGRGEEGRRELEAFARQGRHAGRIELLEKAMAERPTAEGYLELARLHADLGQDSLAAVYLTRATGLDPLKAAPQEVERMGMKR